MKLTLFILYIGLCLISGGCSNKDSSLQGPHPLAANAVATSRIKVEPVKTAEFPQDEVKAPGKIVANPNRIAKIVMPVAGRVQRVLVQLGDGVKQGQPLLVVDSPEAGAALANFRQTQAQLRQAQSALSKVGKDLDRLRELFQHGATPLKEVTAAENDLVQAQSALEQTQAACADSQHRLDLLGLKPGQPAEVTVYAPIQGKVLEIAIAPGEYRNDTSAPLMTITDLSTVWVTSNVPESAIRLIEVGERIEIEFAAFPGEIYHGRVKRISDTVDVQTRTIQVQAELENSSGRLRPEMFGNIRHSHGSRTLLAVPSSAVLHKQEGAEVLVETSEGKYKPTRVSVGEPSKGLVPVFSGLLGGERVVVDGAILLGSE
jgi:membrane fusion protein, heavy metal efflux system